MVSFKTIYRWLYTGRLVKGVLAVLRHKGKRQKPTETRGKFAVGKTISQRPKEVRSRKTSGHWELDTVVSSRGKSKGCVATFIERKTRLYTAIQMPDRTSLSIEIACYGSLEATHGIHVYFADPYSSWQRDSDKNANGLLREFPPKGTDFAQITDEALEDALHFINNRHRKCLGWRTTHDSFSEELSHLV